MGALLQALRVVPIVAAAPVTPGAEAARCCRAEWPPALLLSCRVATRPTCTLPTDHSNLMSTLEEQNREVGGDDEDGDEEDTGMGSANIPGV
jgi:hypothetical protein